MDPEGEGRRYRRENPFPPAADVLALSKVRKDPRQVAADVHHLDDSRRVGWG